MRFNGLDLNLIVALDALLESCNVSRAADRLHLSQPAVSASLSKLRNFFDDQLLVLHGKQMILTPFAEDLVSPLKTCIRVIDDLIQHAVTFDPATSKRTFLIMASDYVVAAVLAPAMGALASLAPFMKIELLAAQEDTAQQMDDAKIDLALGPEPYLHPDHPMELVYEEQQMIVGRAGHPLFAGPIDEAAVFSHGHVAVALGRRRLPAFADGVLASMGKRRRVEVTTSSFLTVPWLLQGTDRLAFIHERLAHSMAERFQLQFARSPFSLPAQPFMLQYHRTRHEDPGLAWLCSMLIAAIGPIPRQSGPPFDPKKRTP